MADKTSVTELIVDARGAEQGTAVYVRAMQSAQRAVDQTIDRELALEQAIERQTVVMTGGAVSITKTAQAWDRLRSSLDPVVAAELKAQNAMERARISADNAVKRGLATEVQAAGVIEQLRNQQVIDLERVRAAQQRVADSQVVGANVANDNWRRQSLGFQLQDIGVQLAGGANPLLVLTQQGGQIMQLFGPGEGGIGGAIRATTSIVTGLAVAFAPLIAIVGTIAVGFAAMTTEINKTAQTQVSVGDVFVSTWQLASEAVLRAMQPILDWFGDLWATISPVIADVMERLMDGFDLAFRNIAAIWSGLPAALGDFTIKTTNAVLGALEDMINGAIGLLNSFIRDANGVLGSVGLSMGELGQVAFGEVANPFAGADQGLTDKLNQNAADVNADNKVGAIGDRAEQLARIREEAEGAAAAVKSADESMEAFLDRVEEGQQVFEDTRTPFEQMGIELSRLGQLLQEGVINWDTYGRAAGAAMAGAASTTLGALGNLSAGLSQAFEDNKVLAIATAVLKGAEAVASAYAAGNAVFGPIGGAAFAAVAAITAAANVAAVAGVTKSSKSMPGGAGGGGAAPTVPTAAPGRGASLVLQGKPSDMVRLGDVECVFNQLQDWLGVDGKQLVVSYKGN